MDYVYLGVLGFVLLFCAIDFFITSENSRDELAWQWPLHLGLAFVGQIVGFLIPFSIWSASNYGISLGFTLGQNLIAHSWVLALLVWGLSESFVVFGQHFALHKFRPLWAFHRIHHSDERLDATTAFRHHPAEEFIGIVVLSLLALVMTPALSVLVAWYLFTMLIDLFNHSRIKLPVPVSRALEWVIVTPRIHRVHHSRLAQQTDSNFGGTFTFWDRLFGTFRCEAPIALGLDDQALAGAKSRDFDNLLLEPFKFLAKR